MAGKVKETEKYIDKNNPYNNEEKKLLEKVQGLTIIADNGHQHLPEYHPRLG